MDHSFRIDVFIGILSNIASTSLICLLDSRSLAANQLVYLSFLPIITILMHWMLFNDVACPTNFTIRLTTVLTITALTVSSVTVLVSFFLAEYFYVNILLLMGIVILIFVRAIGQIPFKLKLGLLIK